VFPCGEEGVEPFEGREAGGWLGKTIALASVNNMITEFPSGSEQISHRQKIVLLRMAP